MTQQYRSDAWTSWHWMMQGVPQLCGQYHKWMERGSQSFHPLHQCGGWGTDAPHRVQHHCAGPHSRRDQGGALSAPGETMRADEAHIAKLYTPHAIHSRHHYHNIQCLLPFKTIIIITLSLYHKLAYTAPPKLKVTWILSLISGSLFGPEHFQHVCMHAYTASYSDIRTLT